jgi:hypothetical protein
MIEPRLQDRRKRGSGVDEVGELVQHHEHPVPAGSLGEVAQQALPVGQRDPLAQRGVVEALAECRAQRRELFGLGPPSRLVVEPFDITRES